MWGQLPVLALTSRWRYHWRDHWDQGGVREVDFLQATGQMEPLLQDINRSLLLRTTLKKTELRVSSGGNE